MRKNQAIEMAAETLPQETQDKIDDRWHCEGKGARVVSRTFQWRILPAIVQNVFVSPLFPDRPCRKNEKRKKPDITALGIDIQAL
jgi:hypothetical protein